MDDKIIFVTAFKDIGRKDINLFSRSGDEYCNYFYNLASNIDYNLVVFIEQELKHEMLKKYKFGYNICFVDFNSVETFYHKHLAREEEIIQSDVYKNKIPRVKCMQSL